MNKTVEDFQKVKASSEILLAEAIGISLHAVIEIELYNYEDIYKIIKEVIEKACLNTGIKLSDSKKHSMFCCIVI